MSASAEPQALPPGPKSSRLRRWLIGDLSWRRMFTSIAIIYGALLCFAIFASESLIFQPHSPGYADGQGLLKLTVAGGEKIAAVYLPNPAAKLTLLYSHGNAEDLGDVVPHITLLAERLGVSVLAYDYRGYGRSEGKTTEQGCYEDIDAAYRYLTETLGVLPSQVIVVGRSVGSGPSTDLAARRPVGGLILESAFRSAFTVATKIPIVPFDRFRNIAKIGRIDCPVLVMHGAKDQVVPYSHGRALFAAAKEPKRALWIPQAGHNDFAYRAGRDYWSALSGFLTLIKAGPAGQRSAR